MDHHKFRIVRGENGKYYIKLTDQHYEIILQSGAFGSKAAAEREIETIRISALYPERFRRGITRDGKLYFDLVSVNGDIVGTSRLYKTERSRDRGIQAVKEYAPGAPVEIAQ